MTTDFFSPEARRARKVTAITAAAKARGQTSEITSEAGFGTTTRVGGATGPAGAAAASGRTGATALPAAGGGLSSAQRAFFAAQEKALRLQRDVLDASTAASEQMLRSRQAIEAARKSPENITKALLDRREAATDYQFQLAGLPVPAAEEAQKGTGIGIRERRVGPEERATRKADIDGAQANLAVTKAREREGNAGVDASIASLRVQEENAVEQAQRQAEADFNAAQNKAGFTFDTETQQWITKADARVRAAQRGVVFDEINNQFISRNDLLGRTDPNGNVLRTSDGTWVDPKTGNEFKAGQWTNPEDGTTMINGVWYDQKGNWHDDDLGRWRQAGTGFVQSGIYWQDPATGINYWQGAPVKRPATGGTSGLSPEAQALLAKFNAANGGGTATRSPTNEASGTIGGFGGFEGLGVP